MRMPAPTDADAIFVSEMRMAVAADTACNGRVGPMHGTPLIGLKVAVMLRLGVTDTTAMLAAIDGAELVDFARVVRMSTEMVKDPVFEPLLYSLEFAARQIIDKVKR